MSANDQKAASGWSAIIAAVVLLTIAYVLSVGPACELEEHGWLPESALFVYLPLEFIMDKSQTIDAIVWWYIELFDLDG